MDQGSDQEWIKALIPSWCRVVVKRLQRPKPQISENGFWEFLDARIEQDGEDPLKPATIKRWKGRVIPHVASPLPDFNPGLQDWKGRTMGFSP